MRCATYLRRSLAAKIGLSLLVGLLGSMMLRVIVVVITADSLTSVATPSMHTSCASSGMSAVRPEPAWAAEIVQKAAELSAWDFWLACATGTGGGLVSLFRELKDDWSKFRFLWAIGHMVTAQFASLLTYLLAVHEEFPLTLALVASGIFGWLGNAGLEKLSKVITRAFGLNTSSDAPPK